MKPHLTPERHPRLRRARKMGESLRGRLLIVVFSLLVIGLLISDLATYALFQRSLLSRIDDQLTARSTVDTAVFVLNGARGPGPASVDYPTGTVIELLNPDGSVATAASLRVQTGMRLGSPGNYQLFLNVCFSDYSTCRGSSGDWEVLSGSIVITVQ